MSDVSRRRFVPAPRPAAEPMCLLTKEWAERRQVPADALFGEAVAQSALSNGAEYRFEAKPGLWERLSAFVDEEKECCPFFSFEQIEEDGEMVLRITRAEAPPS